MQSKVSWVSVEINSWESKLRKQNTIKGPATPARIKTWETKMKTLEMEMKSNQIPIQLGYLGNTSIAK